MSFGRRSSKVLVWGALALVPSLALPFVACSSPANEASEQATEPLIVSSYWVDGNVQSFKPLPSNPGIIYVLGMNGNLWREVGNMSNRTQVDGNVRGYQPMDGTVVYVLGSDLKLWREVGNMSNRTLVTTNVSGFQVTTDGAETVYYLDPSQQLWMLPKGKSPTLLSTGVNGYWWVQPYDVAAAALYVVKTDGTLWRGNPTFSSKAQIDSNVSSVHPVDGLSYYAEHKTSSLYAYRNTSQYNTYVDTNVEFFWPLNDMTTFVEDTSFNLWREQFSARNRDLVDTNVKAYQPTTEDAAYVLHFDGNLWFENLSAPACNYQLPTNTCEGVGFVQAWAMMTASGTCPNIPGTGGYWSTTLLPDGGVPGDGQLGETPPTCAEAGLPSNCCVYVWYPSTPTSMQDQSVLCGTGTQQISAIAGCGASCPVGMVCPWIGMGGCASCSPVH